MNYTWDAVLRAQDQGIPRHKVAFHPAKRYSPYMELAFVDLNARGLDDTCVIEVNPHYRFEHLFGPLLGANLALEDEIVQPYLDFGVHLVTDAELKRGMGYEDFQKLLLLRDMLFGVFGENARRAMGIWSRPQRDIVLNALIGLYATGASLELLAFTLKQLYPALIFYHAKGERNLVLLYLGVPDTQREHCLAAALMDLFLPLHFEADLYYAHHFGIIAVDEIMQIDATMIC